MQKKQLHKKLFRHGYRPTRKVQPLTVLFPLGPIAVNPFPPPLTKMVLVCYSYVETCKKCMDLKIAKIKHRALPIQSQYSALSLRLIHHWNPLFKGFIFSHFEQVGCVGHHGVLQSTGTVGMSSIFCGVPHTYPPMKKSKRDVTKYQLDYELNCSIYARVKRNR